jgi:hypothetical protein
MQDGLMKPRWLWIVLSALIATNLALLVANSVILHRSRLLLLRAHVLSEPLAPASVSGRDSI